MGNNITWKKGKGGSNIFFAIIFVFFIYGVNIYVGKHKVNSFEEKNYGIFMIFVEIFMILADFLLPVSGSVSLKRIRIRLTKMKRIRIRNTVLVPCKKLREFTLLYCNLNWTSLVLQGTRTTWPSYLGHPQVQYTPDDMNYYAGPWDYVENLQSP